MLFNLNFFFEILTQFEKIGTQDVVLMVGVVEEDEDGDGDSVGVRRWVVGLGFNDGRCETVAEKTL